MERKILAALRDEEFFSLGELNRRITQLLESLNDTPFQKLEGTGRSEFERVDKPTLRPLPPQPYRYVEIKGARVNIDYHVEYKKTLYSVPHNYIGERVEIHADGNIVEIYFREKLIAHSTDGWTKGVTKRSLLTCRSPISVTRSGTRRDSGGGQRRWERKRLNG